MGLGVQSNIKKPKPTPETLLKLGRLFGNVIDCDTPNEPCQVCGKPSKYIEINFEAGFCSAECLMKFNDEFVRAVMK